MNIKAYLEDQKKRVDRFLESLFTDRKRLSSLTESVRYSLLAGGKRIRPVLTLAACEACGMGEEGETLSLPVGAALELIHTYSLIHDDLPAMDNDDLRRGRPTNHKVYGEAMAILAGDTLLTEAFHLISNLKTKNPERLLKVIGEISQAAGANGMAGGQAIDLEAQGKLLLPQQLEQLHRMKTGCLMEASVVVGAMLADADTSKLRAIRDYGAAIGLSFQIADDILDVEGGTEELGKPAGSDEAKSKPTYPSILGLEASRRLAQESTDRALNALHSFDERAEPLREIARYIISRRS
ncbi:MAG: polyprenyl synthetase family protein [Deltaproteobacteria bacterium]|nr:polyprenyl synthetase family protein [Deltaproteobacteria bacterium]